MQSPLSDERDVYLSWESSFHDFHLLEGYTTFSRILETYRQEKLRNKRYLKLSKQDTQCERYD